jgi:PAS domain S-box-containing protein
MPEVERYFTLAPEMVVIAGFDGYWKRVNPTVEALLGYSKREALGRPFMELVHPDDRERSEEAARHVLEGTTIRAFENRMLCKDGSHKWIEWTVTPVPEERVMYGVGRDVTERRRSESEQAALQRIATLVAQEVPQADVFGARSPKRSEGSSARRKCGCSASTATAARSSSAAWGAQTPSHSARTCSCQAIPLRCECSGRSDRHGLTTTGRRPGRTPKLRARSASAPS